MASSMAPPTDRTAVVAHYVITRARAEKLGKVKLNKVMWYADLESYRRFGHTITGQRSYQKLQHGPVPNNIVRATRSLERDGAISLRTVATPVGQRHEFVWLKEADVTQFSSAEVDILNTTIDWVCDNHSACSISDLSHDALWEETDLNEQIPIGAASLTIAEATAEEISWALKELPLAPEE